MKVGTDGVLLGAWVKVSDDTESILDIGTGTGLIALQMAQRTGAETIDALEIENKAFEQAVENFENSSWADRLYCYHTSLQEFEEEIEEQYDLIVSNPPYVTISEKEKMERHVLDYEPHLALFVENDDPLIFYNAVIERATSQLFTNGKLYFEINEALGKEVKYKMEQEGFIDVEIIKDMQGKDRIVKGQLK
jgi:HemK-like putative methylase